MKPLERCANGCDAAPQRPSKVLCIRCLAGLSEKMKRLGEALKAVEAPDA